MASGEIVLYQSKLIPADTFLHGFPERGGGVSQGLRASLNLGYRWGDDRDFVDENRQLLADHVGFAIEDLQVTRHVHGVKVWTVGEPLPEPPEFDGLVSATPGAVLGAFAADCIPLVFADANAKVCGAAHAGWRGTVDGVAKNVVAKMIALGARAEDIVVALGPSIGPCCFEVGDEVVDAFTSALGQVPGLVVDGPVKKHIDLRVATIAILGTVGVTADRIDAAPPCTKCEGERFFSYRRDGMMGGVHMGYIALRK